MPTTDPHDGAARPARKPVPSPSDLRTLLGAMDREHLERMLAQLAVTAPDEFEVALNALDFEGGE